VVLYRSTRNLI